MQAATAPTRRHVHMQIEIRNLDELHEDPENVRAHGERSVASIRASLGRFGQQKPIVIDANGRVIAGNGTLRAAREMGWTSLAVVVTNIEDADEQFAFGVADNRAAELSDWDWSAIGPAMKRVKDPEQVGFTPEELETIGAILAPPVEPNDEPHNIGGDAPDDEPQEPEPQDEDEDEEDTGIAWVVRVVCRDPETAKADARAAIEGLGLKGVDVWS